MKHLGDITKINGYETPVVDCIIGGSPCQDLSLAGKRAGLAGARSGLYMEQIRIIKEMREQDVQRGKSDVDIRPRYMVWENVPGAFSTNQGKDFAAVLEEAIRVAEPEAPNVDVPEKGWPTSGCFYDEMGKWSVAWRVLDAQFWGTSDKPLPQRRRRIALVADFGGLSASEILFVRKGVSGDIAPGEPTWKEDAGDAGEGAGGTSCCIQGSMIGRADKNGPQGDGINEDVSFTLNTTDRHAVVYGISPYHSNCMKSDNPHSGYYEAETSRSLDAMNCGYPGCNQGGMAVVQPMQTYQQVTGPLMANSHPGSYTGQDAFSDMLVAGVDCRNATEYPEMNATLQSDAAHNLNSNNVVRVKHIVRRLTPLECERLQGFPDGWTLIGEPVEEEVADYSYIFDESKYIEPRLEDFGLTEDDLNDYAQIDEEYIDDDNYFAYIKACNAAQSKAMKKIKIGSHKETNYYYTDIHGKRKKVSDSARYKALGNSIAIPPWKWVLKRLCACYERDVTMASLFDGIGGFPYIWEQFNGNGSCLWASEVEEFPMAVTKRRFCE